MNTRILSSCALILVGVGCHSDPRPPQSPSPVLTSAEITAPSPAVRAAPPSKAEATPELRITNTIHRRLANDWALASSAPTVAVSTEGRKVTLEGFVRTDFERASIEIIAWQTPGVQDVEDRLELRK